MMKYYMADLTEGSSKIGDRIIEASKDGIYLNPRNLLKDKLNDVGVILQRDIGYELEFSDLWTFEKAADHLRHKYKIIVKELKVELDYERINQLTEYGLESLGEALLPKNMQKHNVKSTIKKYLDGIDCKNNTLYITDPYLFNNTGDNQNILIDLLRDSHVKKIIAYYEKDRDIKKIIARIKSLGITLQTKKTSDIHDRFWICPETRKGFAMGTSINGICKRLALIDYLLPADIDDIILELKKIL